MAQPATVDHHRREITVEMTKRLYRLNRRLERAKTVKKAVKADGELVATLRAAPEETRRIWLAVQAAALS